jgi:hypothetical protein
VSACGGDQRDQERVFDERGPLLLGGELLGGGDELGHGGLSSRGMKESRSL